mmetsp:Transcript_18818/g.52569  ORF Transcript_18818/g.52569 Transcript_18818/m.52569 type:complete len:185 (+) Transcript_18818:130-684(+)
MAAIGLAIVGKNNSPLYVREFLSEDGGDSDDPFEDDEAAVLFGLESTTGAEASSSVSSRASGKCWFALHAALDRLEQLTTEPVSGKKKNENNFVGLLLPFGETRIYGYQANTRVSFLLVVEDYGAEAASESSGVERLFKTIYELYVQEVMNPFHHVVDNPMDHEQLSSKSFDRRVQKHVSNFNQ